MSLDKKKRTILVTAALPYANGDIHIGHLVEYLQVDFWVRYQKMRGNECLFFCADDTHGTPIMMSARQQAIAIEQLIKEKRNNHIRDFKAFEIEFTHYSSTNSEINRELCEQIFHFIREKDYLKTETVTQLYSEVDKMFLPDRFVKGRCPFCQAKEQYGDSCDKCSRTYESRELLEPYSVISKDTPIEKKSEHLFFQLEPFKDFLREWVTGHTAKDVSNKLLEWFDDELKPWNISRDKPYFGFSIPGYSDKYFYVWVDAPIGYIATTKEWCLKTDRDFKFYWGLDSSVELYHFIGKDIVYFHALFWPALLKTANFRLPNKIFVHGFLTVNGEKMSKSKGTFISVEHYLRYLEPFSLRYYLATKMNDSSDDIDFNIADFVDKVNAELLGKITNLASRSARILEKNFQNKLSSLSTEGEALWEDFNNRAQVIASFYEERKFSKALVEIRNLAETANRYVDKKKPWVILRSKDKEAIISAQNVLTDTLNLFRLIVIFLKPILPSYVAKVENFFNEDAYDWNSLSVKIENVGLKPYKHLMTKIELSHATKMVEDNQETNNDGTKKNDQNKTPSSLANGGVDNMIDIEHFAKLDLRVVKILSAEDVKESNRLLRLVIDVGNGVTRPVLAGLKKHYRADELIGRLAMALLNLKPRKMKFGVSEAMLLCVMTKNGSQTEAVLIDFNKSVGVGDRIQ